jgi:hypothetical protein
VRPNGVWISRKKYISNTVTLVLIKDGKKVQQCPYDMGQPVPGPANAAITGYNLSVNSGVVSIAWTSAAETGLALFAIDRKLASATEYEEGVQAGFAQGAGTAYSAQDNPGQPGSYNYRIRAVFNNGTSSVLDEKTIDIANPQIPDAQITGYTLSATSGVVSVAWTSTVESSISIYIVDRKPSSYTDFEEGVQGASPQGVGTAYSIQDNPGAAGSWDYRLRVMFDTGSESVLAQDTVTI